MAAKYPPLPYHNRSIGLRTSRPPRVRRSGELWWALSRAAACPRIGAMTIALGQVRRREKRRHDFADCSITVGIRMRISCVKEFLGLWQARQFVSHIYT